MSLRFALPFGGRAKINSDVVAIFDRHRQRDAADLEAGGHVLGRILRESLDVIGDEVTEPGPGDERTRFSFHLCDLAHHQGAIDAAWERSAGTSCYLGDWHTHAEPDPTPSGVDLSNWRRMLREPGLLEYPRLLFVIVGTERIRVWQGDRTSREIREAPPLGADASAALDRRVCAALSEHHALTAGVSPC